MTKIAWTEFTYNPIIGCSKVSDGCKNCYAEKMACRLAHMGRREYQDVTCSKDNMTWFDQWSGNTKFVEAQLDKPLKRKKPAMFFVCSMGDLFHESVPFEWVDRVMAVVALCPQHTFQVLTKRPERMLEYFTESTPIHGMYLNSDVRCRIKDAQREIWYEKTDRTKSQWSGLWPLRNLWLGVTAENQETADERIPILLDIPAAVRFVSVEPMLEGINLDAYMGRQYGICNAVYSYSYLDQVIIGCESGSGRRLCKVEWIQSAVDQCAAAGVPVFVKQIEVNGKVNHNPAEWPESLQVRQWPTNF